MNNEICNAIANKNIIEFYYKGGTRTVEPHCYGVHKDTHNEVLRGYQIGGYSESRELPYWRLYIVPDMSGLRITDNLFSNPRPGYNPDDSHMSQIFCNV